MQSRKASDIEALAAAGAAASHAYEWRIVHVRTTVIFSTSLAPSVPTAEGVLPKLNICEAARTRQGSVSAREGAIVKMSVEYRAWDVTGPDISVEGTEGFWSRHRVHAAPGALKERIIKA